MNEELTKDWVKRALFGTLNFGRRLLVWDAYKCHLTDSVKNVADKVTNSDLLSVIPGGLTGHVQPADLCCKFFFFFSVDVAAIHTLRRKICKGQFTYTKR